MKTIREIRQLLFNQPEQDKPLSEVLPSVRKQILDALEVELLESSPTYSDQDFKQVKDAAYAAITNEGIEADVDEVAHYLADNWHRGGEAIKLTNDRDEIYDWVFEACQFAIDKYLGEHNDHSDTRICQGVGCIYGNQ
jgi:hypothetical protein